MASCAARAAASPGAQESSGRHAAQSVLYPCLDGKLIPGGKQILKDTFFIIFFKSLIL